MTLTLVTPAFGDVKVCLERYENGQRLRKQSKLLEARRTLQQCAQEACPAALRKDCLAWADELASEVPSIAVKAQGTDGCDRPHATFTVDGSTTRQEANGLLVELDPGPHVVRADIDGKPVEQSIVVAARERGRIVTLTADPAVTSCRSGAPGASSPPPATGPKDAAAPSDAKEGSRPLSPLSIGVGATGVVALGVGTFFLIQGFGQKSDLDACRGACLQDDVDAMNRSFLIGDIAIGASAVALVVAAVLHFTR